MTTFAAWSFDQCDDSQGWVVPPELGGKVWGGSLWLTLGPTEADSAQVGQPHPPKGSYSQQMFGPKTPGPIVSPEGTAVAVSGIVKVRLRLLNHSSETDGLIWWRLADRPDVDNGVKRFSMKPYASGWQEVVCHLDGVQGTISQLRIQPYVHGLKGDIYLDAIRVTDGEVYAPPARPDVWSDAVVPTVVLPAISQADFQDAFKVLDECIFLNVPVMGFEYPIMGPGGGYGENWWQLDTSLTQAGAKWSNQTFSENIVRGLMGVQAQNPDGRIDLWGGAPGRGQPGDVSSIPRYFEIAYDVARRSDDAAFREQAYLSMKDYLDWWLSPVKRKAPTGLISATAEETCAATVLDPPGVLAAVDTNVAVAVGCWNVSLMAERLGKREDARYYRKAFEALKSAINTYLWDEEHGYYCNYHLVENRRIPRLLAPAFDPLRLGIAPPERAERLLEKLTDPALFNWGGRAITSIAKTEPDFVEAVGPYDGRAWFGDIWTMRNLPVIAGLEDLGRHDLAADLAWRTVQAFNANYCEYVVPSTGSGEGVQRYGWSASQYIQSVVEHLFGVDYDAMEDRLTITPNLPEALFGETVSLKNLQLAAPVRRVDVEVTREASGETRIVLSLRGDLPKAFWVGVPGTPSVAATSARERTDLQPVPGATGMTGVDVSSVRGLAITFKP